MPSRRRFLQQMALIGAGLTTSPPAARTEAGLTDSLDVAHPGDEAAHGFASGGAVTRAVVGDRVGEHDLRRPARRVRGKGSWLSYRLRVSPNAPMTFEFEERYGRDHDVRGYQILVDDTLVFLRTFRGSGAGPIHFFVQLPPTEKTHVTLKLRNLLDAPFDLSRLWVYQNFERYFNTNALEVPFYLAPTVRLSFSDYAADRAKLEPIHRSLGAHPNVRPAFTTWIPYAAWNARETEAAIDHVLHLAEDSSLPAQIAFDTWWASTPSGTDGRGGFWTDVAYQQVVYQGAERRYQLSIPNQWSNTP